MKRNLQTDYLGEYSLLLEEQGDFRVRLKDCIRVTVLDDGVYKRHTHVVYEIMILKQGEYRCNLDGMQISMNPGELLLVQPGQVHEDILTKGGILYAFHFQIFPNAETLVVNHVFKKDVQPCQQIIGIAATGLETLIGFLKHENASGTTNAFRLNNAIFEVIFRKVLASFPSGVLHEQFRQQIVLNRAETRLLNVFKRFVFAMPTLEDLCREVAMSRSNLHRLTQRLFGLPPYKAFIRFKMGQVKMHIQENTDITVKELSDLFGFHSPSHFSWAFHQECGVYPREMIKRKW